MRILFGLFLSAIALFGQNYNLVTAPSQQFNITLTSPAGFPTVTINGNTYPAIGYQGGAGLPIQNGRITYPPYQTLAGGTSWTGAIAAGVPNSVVLQYTPGTFPNVGSWSWFDLKTLSWTPRNGQPSEPSGFDGAVNVGNYLYFVPASRATYPIFVQYNTAKACTDPTAYQLYVPPPRNKLLGPMYGWNEAVYDGRFIYYIPMSDAKVYAAGGIAASGNVLRYDTTAPFGADSSWANFNMGSLTLPVQNVDGVQATGFQSGVYDGHRYIYYIPFHNNLIVRYDTWNGGSSPDPSGFTIASNYTTFNPTLLGTAGQPGYTGSGSVANLVGFTGATVAYDSAGANEYLYLVPWATFPGGTNGYNSGANPHLQSTTARVKVGTVSGAVWSPVDITDSGTTWEIYDISALTAGASWPAGWPKTHTTPAELAGQSSLAGWEQAYVTAGPPYKIGFFPDAATFYVQHSVDSALATAAAWSLAQRPAGYANGTQGGVYDTSSATIWPSSPQVPVFQTPFTQTAGNPTITFTGPITLTGPITIP